MLTKLDGCTAVVTGAASGIGLGLARRCAARGMNVAMLDVEAGALADAAPEVGAHDRVLPLTLDVTDSASMEAAATAVADRFGAVHLLCNNAGVSITGPLWTMTEQDYRWLLDVNVIGVANGIHAFVPRMIASGEEGHVVSTSSLAGLTPMPNAGLYSATKAAVVAMSECLLFDLRDAGARIGVSVLCPGLVNTNILDSPRNRPSAHAVTGDLPIRDGVRRYFTTGDDPLDVADQVLHAVEHDDFYVLTTEASRPDIAARADATVQLTQPPRPHPDAITPTRALDAD